MSRARLRRALGVRGFRVAAPAPATVSPAHGQDASPRAVNRYPVNGRH